MMEVEIDGIPKLQRKMVGYGKRTRQSSDRLLRKQARQLRDEIREAAPRDTGAYAKSIKYGIHRGWQRKYGGQNTIRVYSKHPAAHRLEYGFVGTDSLGRTYNQAPRPHWRPATAAAEKRLPKTFLKRLKSDWRSS